MRLAAGLDDVFAPQGERFAVARELDELRVARALPRLAAASAVVDRLVVVAQRRRGRGVRRIVRARRSRPLPYRWLPPDELDVVDLVTLEPGTDDEWRVVVGADPWR